jgi:translation initiation factor 2 subunit 2
MDYRELLKKAKSELPEIANENERFEIPKVKGHIQGNKTIISNFLQIASTIRRQPEHMLKYILKELAAPGEIKNTLLTIGTKIPSGRINEKIKSYVDKFVICKTCSKPDTKLTQEGNVETLTCQACGASQTIN